MGRRFRRKSKQSASHSEASWSSHHKEALLQYLQDYRDGAQACYYGNYIFDDEDVEDQVCVIGTVVMPVLTKEILEAACLPLPNLGSKQRKMVHEACLEVGLFHASTGPSRHLRQMAVSLYADGLNDFTSVRTEQQTHQRPKMYSYPSWYCRNHGESKLVSLEKDMGQIILNLQAHPRDCIRDGVDVVVYDPDKLEDLSQIRLPSDHNDECLVLVDSPQKMLDCIALLEQAKPSELAFDLECYNPSKHAQICCLLQLSCNTLDVDFVIDTLAPGVWTHVSGLARLFADPSVVKVGHSIGSLDITSLHRDFGIFCVNAFDSYEAAKILHLPGKGLGDVCQYYGIQQADRYKQLKEQYQSSDWRARPLTPSMLQYARYDVRFLIALRKFMMRDLVLLDKSRFTSAEEPVEMAVSMPDDVRELDSDEETPKKKNRSLLSLFRGKSQNSPQKGNGLATVVGQHAANSVVDSDDKPAPVNVIEVNASTSFDTSIDPEDPESNDASLDGEPVDFNQDTGELFFFTPEKSVASRNPGSTYREQFWTPETIPSSKVVKPFVADADSLREHPRLMETLTLSQKSCKAFFTLKKEPHAQNTLFISLLQRAAKNQGDWGNDNTMLYARLASWRADAAARLDCLPGFVASLEFLAGVAWKLPQSMDGLKLISSDLPDALVDNEYLCDEILAIVKDCVPHADPEKLYLYADKQRRVQRARLMKNAALTVAVSAGLGCILLMAQSNRKRVR